MDMIEYIRSIHADHELKIEKCKAENSIFWNALRDIMKASTIEEARSIAYKAERDVCPFAKLLDEEKKEMVEAA
ncbi:hypothetical protein [Cohnella sp. GCM10027633]|uniref:hypothetical protein n=1 Tax=unclassified Cohnella TaxID=2636738 RepID=UPI00362FD551